MKTIRNRLKLMKTPPGTLNRLLREVEQRARSRTDISDHLVPLFLDAIGMAPRLIVELGAGDGESTFVFERVAKLWQATLVSVDIEDRREVGSYRRRFFVHRDDIAFADEFPAWCAAHALSSRIDILFIDTSHLYDHTVQEISHWFPFLSPRAKVVFHDTNMKEVFVRKDGSTGRGWNNDRGVIRAVEEYFGCTFAEGEDFLSLIDGWFVRHVSSCNGFTILDRYAG